MTTFFHRLTAIVALIAIIEGCAQRGPQDGSFKLECSGRGTVELRDYDKDKTTTQRNNLTQFFLYWDAAKQSLQTENAPLDAEDFCHGDSQEACSAQVASGRLSAKSLKMLTGKLPGQILGYEEEIEVNLQSLEGRYFIRQGKVTDRAGEMIRHSKLEIDTPLRCRHVT